MWNHRQWSPWRITNIAIACALMTATLGSTFADKTVPEGIGVVVKDVTVEVVRGGKVKVPLSGSVRGNASLEYSIFRGHEPKFGKLGPVVRGDRQGEAAVIYQSDADSGAAVDQFKYRARGIGLSGPPSLAATVTIKISEPQPMLSTDRELNFGRVPFNTTAERQLLVTNRGTGPFRGALRPPPPFAIAGGMLEVDIPVGATVQVPVRYSPGNDPKLAQVGWVLQPDSLAGRVVLKAQGFAPFSVSVAQAELTFDAETGSRNAKMTVDNPGLDEALVKLTMPARVRCEVRQVSVPPRGSAELEISIPSEDVAPLKGEIVFEGEIHRLVVPMVAKAVPAQIRVVEPAGDGGVHFDGEFGEVLSAEVKLENLGGEKAFLSALVNPPFSVVEGDGGRVLEAGETLSYQLQLKPDRIGPVAEDLRIGGGDRPIVIPLTGTVTLPPGMEPPPPVIPKEPERAYEPPRPDELLVADVARGRAEFSRKVGNTIPPVNEVKLESIGNSSLTFSWPHPAGETWGYVVETEVHRLDEDTGMPYPLWVELGPQYAKVGSDSKRGWATVEGLKPGSKYTFRLLTRDGSDTFSQPGARLVFFTEKSKGPFGWFRLWMVALLCAGVAGVLYIVRKIQYERELYS